MESAQQIETKTETMTKLPSTTSSPSHDFTFTISLNASAPLMKNCTNATFEIDLAPADDIFYHGHLLPLHHPPRPSNASVAVDDDDDGDIIAFDHRSFDAIATKPKSLSSFFAINRWRKGRRTASEEMHSTKDDVDDKIDKKKKRRIIRFDQIRRIWMSMMEPLLSLKGEAKGKRDLRRRPPYSFSGNLNPKGRGGGRGGGRGSKSLPTSMKTSPTNSGLLLAAPAMGSSAESSMEELQSAIQAAIAHCKNSTTIKEEKCKL